jgi:hypothetical protein
MKHQRTFVISLVMLVLVVLTACVQIAAEESIEADLQQSEAEPVIIEENETPSGSDFFAANPELMAASRHGIEVDNETLTGSGLYAANPELMAADRYPAPIIEHEETSGSTFLAANPELMAAGRYTSQEKATVAEIFAANPELMTAHRYAATATEK